MRAVSLARVAAEAETIRIRAMAGRHGARAALGAVAAVFGIATLVLIEIIAWQVLQIHTEALYASWILLGVNLSLALVFALLAARSAPSRAEREALRIRQQAVGALRGSLVLTTLIPLLGSVFRSGRSDGPRRLLFRR